VLELDPQAHQLRPASHHSFGDALQIARIVEGHNLDAVVRAGEGRRDHRQAKILLAVGSHQ
jgi:hypothetical protein